MMKFLVAIFLIFCISSSFAENLCGPFGMSYPNNKCLCAAYTSPSEDGLSCVDGEGTCAPPADLFVSKEKSYTLKARARSLHFVGQNLQVVIEFPSIETALTDITIYNKTQDEVSSLGKFVSQDEASPTRNLGTTLGTWTHGVDNTSSCVQIATWTVEWAELSKNVRTSEEGHFAFDISVSSHIEREKSPLSIRAVDIAPSILVDVIPVKINLNEIVSTQNYTDRVELILDYDVKVKYYLKKVHLDPATLKMRIVLEHKISFPLSLKSDHLIVKLGDAVLPSRSYEKVNRQECPATKGSKCLARTIILLHLPTNVNCTRLQLDVGLDLVTKCHGINDHTSKYLCSGLRKSLSRKFVHVDIPIKYNFCPTVEATEVSVTDFSLIQGTNTLIAQEILERDVPLVGNITLRVDESFAGSVFTMARISSIKFVEAGNNPASYEILEYSSVTDGVFDNNQIFISFTYVPSYQQITTYLQNWANQFFIEVTVDVSFYSPQGISKKTANSPIHTSVRLQIPNHGLPKYLKRDSIYASSPNLRLSEAGVKKTLEEHQLTQQKIRTDKMSEEMKDLQKTNQTMITLIIASVAACFVVLIVAAIVIYKLRKSSQQTTQI